MRDLARSFLLHVTCFALLTLPCWSQASSQKKQDKLSPLAENAPQDKPVAGADMKKLDDAIAPYVAQARSTLPGIKQRFTKGLKQHEVLFVTIRLYGPDNKFEGVYLEVKTWKGTHISGLLATLPDLIKGHQIGEKIVAEEKDIYDWTISRPDGTEEGNFVGKFLDTHRF